MLSRLPPRVHMFVRYIGFCALGYLATVGFFALYNGSAKLMPWWYMVALAVGGGLGCLMREVPASISTSRSPFGASTSVS